MPQIRDKFNPRGAPRVVPMQVLVLGCPRTGTLSMTVALEKLGYKTHHLSKGMFNPHELDMWTEAMNAKFLGKGKVYGREEWDQVLGRYQAVTDVSVLFWEEFLAAYPDAKVILTTRDPDQWWKSYNGTIAVLFRSKRAVVAQWLDPRGFGRFREFMRMTVAMSFGCDPRAVKEEDAKARFCAHYESVRCVVPKEKMLEYQVGEGWTRLCEFLEKDVPDIPFPRKNDAKLLKEMSDAAMRAKYRQVALRVLLPLAILAFLFVTFSAGKY
ncbi:P-loop containing nucleoside triphosphate hydrolase protein [Mycena rebaudengoi]|nr:P-loop containing nucleoside triphosphate hydrolase protein [Mycena rebaudengoi]